MVNLEVDFAAFAQTTSPPRLLLKPSKTHKTLGLHQARVEEPNRNKGKQKKVISAYKLLFTPNNQKMTKIKGWQRVRVV